MKSVTLSLSCGYNLAATIQNGGYGTYDSASIPYAVSGTGTKTVSLYVDGVQQNAHTVTRSGTTKRQFRGFHDRPVRGAAYRPAGGRDGN